MQTEEKYGLSNDMFKFKEALVRTENRIERKRDMCCVRTSVHPQASVDPALPQSQENRIYIYIYKRKEDIIQNTN